MLKEALRRVLIEQAQTGRPVTYKEVADRLGLTPPQTIHRVTQALESLMEEDRAAHRPLLAALCVSRLGQNLPGRGFFAKAELLGIFSGDPSGPEAHAFHANEFQRVLEFYERSQHRIDKGAE
ncbi:hypothetical protein [Ciceribacter azotifigens]|uniref:hypothetical protein n=1 Tax=Ciceribacter azotifigens TaxID=2069303 RepID=UPI003A84F2CE